MGGLVLQNARMCRGSCGRNREIEGRGDGYAVGPGVSTADSPEAAGSPASAGAVASGASGLAGDAVGGGVSVISVGVPFASGSDAVVASVVGAGGAWVDSSAIGAVASAGMSAGASEVVATVVAGAAGELASVGLAALGAALVLPFLRGWGEGALVGSGAASPLGYQMELSAVATMKPCSSGQIMSAT